MKKMLSLLFTLIVAFSHAAWQQPPEEFIPPPTPSQRTVGATDGNGHAIAAWLNSGPQASYYSNGAWGPIQTLPTGGDPQIAMDASGTGLLIYANTAATEILTSFFNGTTWVTPTPNPLDTVGFSISQLVAMDGLGHGVAAWQDIISGVTTSSFFSGGSWSALQTISLANFFPFSIAYSTNETAVIVGTNFTAGTAVAYNYLAGTWQGPVTLGLADPFTSLPQVGIDANGLSLAAWVDPSGNINASIFNGTWSPAEIISVGTGNSGVSVAMAPGGTAVVTWQNGTNGFSSSFNGTTFGPVQQFGSSLSTDVDVYSTVSVNNLGNALIIYRSSATGQILSTALPLGGTWQAPLVVKDGADVPNVGSLYSTALSNDGVGFAFWTELDFAAERPSAFASVFIPDPLPPATISGRTCTQKFASQTDRVNIITFTPSTDPTAVSYLLRRNGNLIATIPAAGPYIYFDHHRCKRRTIYTITSVNGFGDESTPLTVVLH